MKPCRENERGRDKGTVLQDLILYFLILFKEHYIYVLKFFDAFL
jgi:hypothetical protein